MSLKGILQGLGRLITKKAKPAQATGQQQKLITYTPETRKLPATEIAKKMDIDRTSVYRILKKVTA